MTLDYITRIIDRKIILKPKIAIFSYHDLRIKEGMSEEEILQFIELATIRLNNLEYDTYIQNEQYQYEGEIYAVSDHEYIVAIKREDKDENFEQKNTKTKCKKSKFIKRNNKKIRNK